MSSDRIVNEDFERQIAEDDEKARDSVKSVVDAMKAGNAYLFSDAIEGLYYTGAFRSAFLAISRHTGLSDAFKRELGGVWVLHGSMIRNGVNDDVLLAKALRNILPPYEGDGLTLFRGEGANNRRYRRYGLCWTSERDVAQSFARDSAKAYRNGAVVLRADVPREAIVANVHELDPENGEYEYLVDRRLLRATMISVLDRLPYTPKPVIKITDFSPE